MGILVINLPNTNEAVRGNNDIEKGIIDRCVEGEWMTYRTREDFEKGFKYVPERIIDKLQTEKVEIAVINWDFISDNLGKLVIFIDEAFKRRKTNEYDHSRPLRRHNG